MKITLSPLYTDAKGTSDKITIARNHYGLYSKLCPKPYDPNTTYQQGFRIDFKYFSQFYNNLTSDDRQTWIDAATSIVFHRDFKDSYKPTAQALFISCNINRKIFGGSLLYTFQQPFISQQFFQIKLSFDPYFNHIKFDFKPIQNDQNYFYKIFITKNLSPGIFYKKNDFKFIETLQPHHSSLILSDATYYARTNQHFTPNCKIFIKSIPVDYGSGITFMPLHQSVIL